MRYLITLILLLLLASCSDDRAEDAEIFAGETDSKIVTGQPDDMINAAARYPSIGGHGILWKPVADSGGKLVVLLNRSYGKPTVRIKNSRNQVIAVGKFVYYSNPNRATYRFDRPGKSYGSCYLVVGKQIFYVPNGARRYE
jgi:hypothetical protein